MNRSRRFSSRCRAGFLILGSVGIGSHLAAEDTLSLEETIRGQVSEGMILAAAAKAAIGETYLSRGDIPQDRTAAGMTADAVDTQGKYVASVDIVDAEIIITYGNEAHANITGKALVLTPFLMNGLQVLNWQCGLSNHATANGGIAIGANSSSSSTTVATKYLHEACLP